MPSRRKSPASLRRLTSAAGPLSTETLTRMSAELPWFASLPPEIRSYVGLVAQAGITGFIAWLRTPDTPPEVAGGVFGAAPRSVARAVTLQQVVEMIRLVVDVIESRVPELAAPGEEPLLREAVLRYSREVAFAAAQVYALAAEERGAWDARLEALVVDAVLRGDEPEAVRSRAAALGWRPTPAVAVIAGSPTGDEPEELLDRLRRAGRLLGIPLLAGLHGHLLVAVVGLPDTAGSEVDRVAERLAEEFGPGPVVLGPGASDLASACRSGEAALRGVEAAHAWPYCPRPVSADELLPERALAGDALARTQLVESVFRPLADSAGPLLHTTHVFLESGGALEAAARSLFVHANTVRYRLRKVAELTGLDASHARDAFTLQLALRFGSLTAERPSL